MKFYNIICVISFCLLFFSCNEKDDWNSIKLDKVELEFSSEGGTAVSTLENNSPWQATAVMETVGTSESQLIPCTPDRNGSIKGDWFIIAHTDNPRQISVTLIPNTGEARKIAITITVDNNGTTLLAKQAAGNCRHEPATARVSTLMRTPSTP